MKIIQCSVRMILICLMIQMLIVPDQHVMADDGDFPVTRIYLPFLTKDFNSKISWDVPLPPLLINYPNYRGKVKLLMDLQERIHIFRDAGSGELNYIYHAFLQNHQWSTVEAIGAPLGYSLLSSEPLIDHEGRIHIVWNNSAYKSDGPYRILYANWKDGQWSQVEELVRSDFPVEGQLALNTSLHAQVLLSKMDGVSNQYIRRSWSEALGWTDDKTFTEPPINGLWSGGGLEAFLIRSGDVNLFRNAHITENGGTFFVYHWEAATGLVTVQEYPGKVQGPEKRMDVAGNLHLAEIGETSVPGGSVFGLRHQCLDQDFHFQPIEEFPSQEFETNWAQAADPFSNHYAIYWIEDMPQNQKKISLKLWDGCTAVPGYSSYTLPTNQAGDGFVIERTAVVPALTINGEMHKICMTVPNTETGIRVLCAEIAE